MAYFRTFKLGCRRMVREMSMGYDHIRVMPLATHVGAEISGIDLARSPGGAALGEIRRALGEYGVVFFRNQQLTRLVAALGAQRIAGHSRKEAVDVEPA